MLQVLRKQAAKHGGMNEAKCDVYNIFDALAECKKDRNDVYIDWSKYEDMDAEKPFFMQKVIAYKSPIVRCDMYNKKRYSKSSEQDEKDSSKIFGTTAAALTLYLFYKVFDKQEKEKKRRKEVRSSYARRKHYTRRSHWGYFE